MSLWPWPSAEAEAVGAEEPIPRWRFWRRQHPPLAPMPCADCGVDARGTHVLVGARTYCLACGVAAGIQAQR